MEGCRRWSVSSRLVEAVGPRWNRSDMSLDRAGAIGSKKLKKRIASGLGHNSGRVQSYEKVVFISWRNGLVLLEFATLLGKYGN